jgi:ferric-dicitrate binding protein FerR (iron transport regulator)
MSDHDRDLPPELGKQWREWASTEPAIDERQLKRNLLERIPGRRYRTRSRLVLIAAAASLLAVLIGLENTRHPRQQLRADYEVVHETGANVILVLREGGEPIYIVTEPSNDRVGE